MMLGMLVLSAAFSSDWQQSQKESAEVIKSIQNLSSDNPSLRKEAFHQLWKTPPVSMTPLIDIVRKMKPVVSPDGTLNTYAIDSTQQFAIRLLGYHRVIDAKLLLIEQIGYVNYDQHAALTADMPTVVKALANMGKGIIPDVIKKLASLEGDGIRRDHCISILITLHDRNVADVYWLVKSEAEKKSNTESETRNLHEVLTYFRYSDERKQYEFVHRPRPPLTRDSDYWRK